ncbi:MAG TPA: aminomethyl-transferring glycine dehydrogenase subunit GcvPA [Burkholderiales bacterium]|nr:aminomethyl-transferring glycine dehydrogenase subunit GcvPA [Burkholderiales bacterium]
MPFIPHTEDEVAAMLAAIGVSRIEDLFEEIPADLRIRGVPGLPEALNEMQAMRLMRERAAAERRHDVYIGAGAYEHHIPAAVWQIATRGEYYTSYTPYQAEASQGTLQLLYEYQSMMTSLTGLAVTNASLYDGASALAEAALMAVRLHKGAKGVIVPRTVDPRWRAVMRTIVRNQDVALTELPYDAGTGCADLRALDGIDAARHAALVIPMPNFFGALEDVDALTDWAHARKLLVIAVVNPLALAVLEPPGAWGSQGADIAIGDGQPLGIPLASGGPYFGFMACREEHMRQMPGRIVGRTVDLDGKTGYTLTLQAREQHIRRSRATSNICTNQGLMVTAATIHMALMGPAGLAAAASMSHANTLHLADALAAVPGVRRRFSAPVFHECVMELNRPLQPVLRALEAEGILGGLDLGVHYPELAQHLLVCATETKTGEDLQRYADAMRRVMS